MTARLNIVWIMAADHGAWALGSAGNRDVRTPVLDRLAEQGTRFSNAFCASPVCTPSRLISLTGLYPHQVEPTLGEYQMFSSWETGIPETVDTWPRVLQRHGYRTGLVGKWHLGRLPQFHPTRHGFDHFYGFTRGSNSPVDPALFRDGRLSVEPGWTEDLLFDDAIRFVEREQDGPFALLIHNRAPHHPYGPVAPADAASVAGADPVVPDLVVRDEDYVVGDPAAYNEIVYRASGRPWPEASALVRDYVRRSTLAYYASIHSIDRNVGRLLARLEELGLADRTVVMYTSDNGYLEGQRGLRGKGTASPVVAVRDATHRPMSDQPTLSYPVASVNAYDESIRIPLIVRWPGVTQPGTTVDALVSNEDTFRTILAMAEVPEPPEPLRQGVDITGLLAGATASVRGDVCVAYDATHAGPHALRAIRTRDWKLVRTALTVDRDQLFDLRADPGETTNLAYWAFSRGAAAHYAEDDGRRDWPVADPYVEIHAELDRRLRAWQTAVGDPMPAHEALAAERLAATRARWRSHDPNAS